MAANSQWNDGTTVMPGSLPKAPRERAGCEPAGTTAGRPPVRRPSGPVHAEVEGCCRGWTLRRIAHAPEQPLVGMTAGRPRPAGMKRLESNGHRVTCISPWCGCSRLRVPIHSDRAPGLPSTERPSPATPLDLRATPQPPKRGRRGLQGSRAALRIPCFPGFSRRGLCAEPRMTQGPTSQRLLNSLLMQPESEMPSPEPSTAMTGDPKMGSDPFSGSSGICGVAP